MSLIAQRYAAALFEVAQTRGHTQAVAADLEQLHAALGTPEGRAFLTDPRVSAKTLADLLDRAMASGSESTRSFLRVLRERRRTAILPDLHAEFAALVRAKAGEAIAKVETARPLGDAEREALRKHLSRLSGKQVVLEVRDNPELLGGVRARIGNTLYDGSLLGELEALQQKLLQTPMSRS